MATANKNKSRCLICNKEKATTKCMGCSEEFCFNHLVEHRQELSRRFDELENERNVFRQILTQQTTNPHQHPLIEKVNQWEKDAIEKIRRTANETREILLKHTNKHMGEIEMKLNKLTEELREIREENDFNEIDLSKLKFEIQELEEKFDGPSNIIVEQDLSTPLITAISVITPTHRSKKRDIPVDGRWLQNAITVAGGRGHGGALYQLSNPWDVDVSNDQTVYIADQSNHRIMEWKKHAIRGEIVAGQKGKGIGIDQLHYPLNVLVDEQNDCLIIADTSNNRVVQWPRQAHRTGEILISNLNCQGMAMDDYGYFYVSSRDEHEIQRYKRGETNVVVVAGGNGNGAGLNQFSDPSFIYVDQDQSIYISDWTNHRVTKWLKDAKESVIVAGGRGQGNSLTQLSHPRGIIVDQMGNIYIADQGNNRVVRWLKGAKEGSIIVGGNGEGEQTDQFSGPVGLAFDSEHNLYVADSRNHRIQKFLFDKSI